MAFQHVRKTVHDLGHDGVDMVGEPPMLLEVALECWLTPQPAPEALVSARALSRCARQLARYVLNSS